MRFWISWWQPGPDPRPLKDPPNPAILAWWETGLDSDGERSLVALVDAPDKMAARLAVCVDWPDAGEWRFCEDVPEDWRPGDRFPLVGWAKDRVDAADASLAGGAA